MDLKNIMPLSHFTANIEAIMKEIRETDSPVVITEDGWAKAVVVSVRHWEKTQNAFASHRLCATCGQEAEAGQDVSFDEETK